MIFLYIIFFTFVRWFLLIDWTTDDIDFSEFFIQAASKSGSSLIHIWFTIKLSVWICFKKKWIYLRLFNITCPTDQIAFLITSGNTFRQKINRAFSYFLFIFFGIGFYLKQIRTLRFEKWIQSNLVFLFWAQSFNLIFVFFQVVLFFFIFTEVVGVLFFQIRLTVFNFMLHHRGLIFKWNYLFDNLNARWWRINQYFFWFLWRGIW